MKRVALLLGLAAPLWDNSRRARICGWRTAWARTGC